MRTGTIAMMLTLLVAGLAIGCNSPSVGKDAYSYSHERHLFLKSDMTASRDCHRCDLRGASLYLAKLPNADLRGVNLGCSNIRCVDLTYANLAGADLSGANLTDAILTRANLTGADLSDANLTGATLGWANLTGADLTGANLSETDLFEANLDGVIGADFSGAEEVPAKYLKD